MNESGYRGSGCVNRIEERYDLGSIGRKRERIDAAGSRASMRDIVHHFIEQIRRSVVEESLREGKQRKQRWRNVTVRPERRRAILANFVECRWIESPNVPQFAE